MFEIRETQDCYGRPLTRIEVDGIQDVPYALKRLAELGYDMERSLEALQEAVEDQRKRKVLHAAINALAEPAKKAEK
jgi:hypothetical protein